MTANLDALARWSPLPSSLSAPLPALEALLAGAAPWLRARAGMLASSSWIVDQAAGVGTALRFCASASAATVATAWIRSLPASDVDALERLAVQQAAELRRKLDDLETIDEAADERFSADLLALLHGRDALESVIAVLWIAQKGQGLVAQLAMLDDLALVSLSAIEVSSDLGEDELLREVFVGEPEAWWGRLACG